MNCNDLIRRFESNAVPEAGFHHADHIQLAFAYLCKYPVLQALEKFTTALKNFAATHNKPQLYHETVTYAFFFLIHERMARDVAGSAATNWDQFARDNADLFIWKNGILSRYYSQSTLESELARRVFLLPDKLLGESNNGV
jgi:hypothetical protein